MILYYSTANFSTVPHYNIHIQYIAERDMPLEITTTKEQVKETDLHLVHI